MVRDFDHQYMQEEGRRRSLRHIIALLFGGALCAVFVTLTLSSCSQQPASGTDAAPAEETAADETSDTSAEAEDAIVADKDEAASEEPAEAEEPAKTKDPQAKARKALAKKLNKHIAATASAANMQVGVCAIDLTTGAVASYQGDTAMVSASMIKLIVAAAFLDQVEAGKFNLDDTYTLQPEDIVGGTGVLAGRGAGGKVTYREMVQKMISVSDNVGTNGLVRSMGMDAVNAEAKKLGLEQTQFNRYMMDEAAIAAGIENYTSAQDVAQLLKMVYEKTFVSKKASKLVLEALEQQEDRGGILNGLPEGTTFAHKTGSLVNARHDGGIVEGEHPFVLAVLCGGEGFYEQGAHDAMASIAQVVYEDIN